MELDGGQHNRCEAKKHDAIRSEYLKVKGNEVMRFWDNEVLLDMESVLSDLGRKVTPPHLPL